MADSEILLDEKVELDAYAEGYETVHSNGWNNCLLPILRNKIRSKTRALMNGSEELDDLGFIKALKWVAELKEVIKREAGEVE